MAEGHPYFTRQQEKLLQERSLRHTQSRDIQATGSQSEGTNFQTPAPSLASQPFPELNETQKRLDFAQSPLGGGSMTFTPNVQAPAEEPLGFRNTLGSPIFSSTYTSMLPRAEPQFHPSLAASTPSSPTMSNQASFLAEVVPPTTSLFQIPSSEIQDGSSESEDFENHNIDDTFQLQKINRIRPFTAEQPVLQYLYRSFSDSQLSQPSHAQTLHSLFPLSYLKVELIPPPTSTSDPMASLFPLTSMDSYPISSSSQPVATSLDVPSSTCLLTSTSGSIPEFFAGMNPLFSPEPPTSSVAPSLPTSISHHQIAMFNHTPSQNISQASTSHVQPSSAVQAS